MTDSVLTFTKRLSAEIWTPEGWSAMALKAAFMMGEGWRGQETKEAQSRASSGIVSARLARERATLRMVMSYSYDGVSAGIWVIHIEVANLGARW